MDEQRVKRTRRTPQQMAEGIDSKIQKLNQELDSLADKRAAANLDKSTNIISRVAAYRKKGSKYSYNSTSRGENRHYLPAHRLHHL